MFKVQYYYSACVLVRTDDVTILCDPWINPGAYDGSWYHFPEVTYGVDAFGQVDLIYISHIHPDHFDPKFLLDYQSKFPKTQIIIADFQQNFLLKKMLSYGLKPLVTRDLSYGQTRLRIIPNESSSYDVDSALVVKRSGYCFVNMNDNLFHAEQIKAVLDFANGPIQFAGLTYTGAGPYPQTYYDDPNELSVRADKKKQEFFNRYLKMKEALNPKWILPFAGKYLLGGHLAPLNAHRGVADAFEVTEFCERAIVLEDGGRHFFDLETEQASAVRKSAYSKESIAAVIEKLKSKKMDYEVKFHNLTIEEVPWFRLFSRAHENAMRKSLIQGHYFFIFKIKPDLNFVLGNQIQVVPDREIPQFEPRSEITIDHRYLFGLLTGIYHWNNAEIGSHFSVRRYPDVFNRDTQSFLNFLHI